MKLKNIIKNNLENKTTKIVFGVAKIIIIKNKKILSYFFIDGQNIEIYCRQMPDFILQYKNETKTNH